MIAIATEEAELVPHFERLLAEACGQPEAWRFVVLQNGWKFMVCCTKNGSHALRFRTNQVPGMAYVEFLREANRCARMLGAGQWKMLESERLSFWEVSFLTPAPLPATPTEAT